MKAIKKVFALLLTAAMVLGMSTTAFAANEVNYSNGSGTITISNASKGEEYSAYQIFGATYNETTKSVAYTLDADSPWYTAVSTSDLFTVTAGDGTNVDYYVSIVGTGTDGEVTDSDNAAVLAFIKSTFATLNLTANFGPTEATGDELVWSAVPYGYYYITSSLGSAVTIDQNTPNATVIDKNTQEPTPPEEGLKTIVITDENGDESYVDETTASVGDNVDFRIALNTVNWLTDEEGNTEQVTKYTFTDTPTNMTIDQKSVVVKVGDTILTATTQDATGDYTLSFDATGKMTIVVTWVDEDNNSLYANNSLLEITYTAEVTSVAADNDANNNATASWNDSTPIEDETNVYTYYFDLTKTDGGKKVEGELNTSVLAGAVFKIYDSQDGTEAIKLVDEGNGVYHVADSTEIAAAAVEGATTEIVTEIVTPTSGKVQVKGLGNGTYWLEETKAPDGYNLLTSRQSFEIKDADKADTVENGTTTAYGVEIENNAGTELPQTGGIGTTIFYVIGSVLVIGAAVLLITKKRMSGTQE